MADLRLNSGHFDDFSRRHQYRRARQDVLAARGLLTLTAEQLGNWVGEAGESIATRKLTLQSLERWMKKLKEEIQIAERS
jgi:hypothetical protein